MACRHNWLVARRHVECRIKFSHVQRLMETHLHQVLACYYFFIVLKRLLILVFYHFFINRKTRNHFINETRMFFFPINQLNRASAQSWLGLTCGENFVQLFQTNVNSSNQNTPIGIKSIKQPNLPSTVHPIIPYIYNIQRSNDQLLLLTDFRVRKLKITKFIISYIWSHIYLI